MDLKEQLNDLSVKLEGKSKEQAEALIKEFEAKHNELVQNQVKEVKDEFTAELEKLQKHANELDVKLDHSLGGRSSKYCYCRHQDLDRQSRKTYPHHR